MNDDIETGLVGFLSADPEVLELVRTLPDPPRIFPNTAPQSVPLDKAHVVYWIIETQEFDSHSGPSGLPNARIMVECRVQSASPKLAKALAKRIKHSRGPNLMGPELHGFRGHWPGSYQVQKAWFVDTRYDYIRPVRAGELGTHIVTLELRVWWNSVQS